MLLYLTTCFISVCCGKDFDVKQCGVLHGEAFFVSKILFLLSSQKTLTLFVVISRDVSWAICRLWSNFGFLKTPRLHLNKLECFKCFKLFRNLFVSDECQASYYDLTIMRNNYNIKRMKRIRALETTK